jgi:hypothetical protein
MPCTNDYPEPTSENRKLQNTAKMVLSFYERAVAAGYSKSVVSKTALRHAKDAAEDEYCRMDLAPVLCSAMNEVKSEKPKLFDEVVYDARSRASRELADWWEEHERADAERLRREAKQKKQAALVESARAKLSDKEYAALKEHFDDGGE